MIIDSPVGRFPFSAERVRLQRGSMQIDGTMGTWPTTVEVPLRALPGLIGRLVPVPAASSVAGAVALGALVLRRRRSRRCRPHTR
jgi:hypothetical protein